MKKFFDYLSSNDFYYTIYYIYILIALVAIEFRGVVLDNNDIFFFIFFTAIFVRDKIEDMNLKTK